MTATGNFPMPLDGLAPMGADRTEVADSALTDKKRPAGRHRTPSQCR